MPVRTSETCTLEDVLGHILRSPDNTHAALSLVHAINGSFAKKRSGSHQANLLKVPKDDRAD